MNWREAFKKYNTEAVNDRKVCPGGNLDDAEKDFLAGAKWFGEELGRRTESPDTYTSDEREKLLEELESETP